MHEPSRVLLLLGTLSAVACIDSSKDDDESADDGATQLDPSGDEDGDGVPNGEEKLAGTDPLDPSDVPYQGGWRKADCRDEIEPTGNGIGEVAENFALVDQFGDTLELHDFCDRVVLIEFSGFT